MTRLFTSLGFIVAIALGTANASAAVLMSEGLDNTGYATGNLVGQPGAGTGSEVNMTGTWSGDDTASLTYQSEGLSYSYSPAQSDGNAVASVGSILSSRSSDGAFEFNRRGRSSTLTAGDYFFSLLMRYEENGSLTLTDGAEAVAGFQASNDDDEFQRSITFGFRNNGGTIEAIMRYINNVDVLSTTVTPGQTYFVVASIDNNADGGSGDPVTAYFNPINVLTEANAAATSTPVTRGATGPHPQVPYRGLLAQNNDTFGDVTFDELLMGEEWDDVTPVGIIPEPATASLLALAGLAMLRRRRV